MAGRTRRGSGTPFSFTADQQRIWNPFPKPQSVSTVQHRGRVIVVNTYRWQYCSYALYASSVRATTKQSCRHQPAPGTYQTICYDSIYSRSGLAYLFVNLPCAVLTRDTFEGTARTYNCTITTACVLYVHTVELLPDRTI